MKTEKFQSDSKSKKGQRSLPGCTSQPYGHRHTKGGQQTHKLGSRFQILYSRNHQASDKLKDTSQGRAASLP
jgi:hypothetical protein